METKKGRKETRKRIYAIVLTFMLVVGILPPMSFADDDESSRISLTVDSSNYFNGAQVEGFLGPYPDGAYTKVFCVNIDKEISTGTWYDTVFSAYTSSRRVAYLMNASAFDSLSAAVKQQLTWRITNGRYSDGIASGVETSANLIWNTYFQVNIGTVNNPNWVDKFDSSFPSVSSDDYPNAVVLASTKNKQPIIIVTPKLLSAQVKVKKTVEGPVHGTNTFSFSLFDAVTGGNLVAGPINVSVEDSDSEYGTFNITVPASAFNNNATVTYYIQENNTNPPQHWTYDNTARKDVTLSKNQLNVTKTFTNTYDPKGTLTVTKTWNGGTPVYPVTFSLQKRVNNSYTTVGQPYTITEENPLVTIGGLELNRKYRVVESFIQDYQPSYSVPDVTFSSHHLNKSIEITNTFIKPVGHITVTKLWDHGNNPSVDQPKVLKLEITKPNGDKENFSVSAAGNWTNTYDTEVFGQYTFTEILPIDYAAASNETAKSVTININPANQRNASIEFSNAYVEPKGTLTVTKEWSNDNGKENFRPETITLNLLKLVDGNYVATDLSTTLPKAGIWSDTFTNLPFGTYKVEEVTVSDYTPSYSDPVTLSKYDEDGGANDRTGGITVTNNFNDPKGSISIEKRWVESDVEASEVRPSKITVSLMKGTEVVAAVDLPKENGALTHTFSDLPLDGSVYTVVESTTGDDVARLLNYDQSVIYGQEEATSIKLDKEYREGSATLINTYAKGTITVVKSWANEINNPIEERPASVQVTLHKVKQQWVTEPGPMIEMPGIPVFDDQGNPLPSSPIMMTGPDIQVLKDVESVVGTKPITRPSTSVVFYDLEYGEGITYYVTEGNVPFYTTVISPESLALSENTPNGTIQVTNTYIDPKGSLKVNKIWNHGYNPSPASQVTVELYKNGEYDQEITFSGPYGTFTDLDLGAVYTIKEQGVTNYEASLDTDFSYTPVKGKGIIESGETTITNSYIPEIGNLTVLKVWPTKGKSGTEVTFTVRRSAGDVKDTEFVREIKLNAENSWTHTFEGLELYGPGGVHYVYTATEQGPELSLYTATNEDAVSLDKEAAATITITNTYAPNKGKLVIQKTWSTEVAPVDKIGYRLVVDGVAEEAIRELTAENGWKAELSDLNVEHTYAVVEVSSFEEFDTTYSEQPVTFTASALEKSITISNTRTEDDPQIDVTKSVVKNSLPLVGGVATFDYTVTLTNTGNRTLTNLTVVDNMQIPQGATAVYVPERVAIGSESGYTIEGTLAPGASKSVSYKVTVNKSGEYTNTAVGHGSYGKSNVSDEATKSVLVKSPGLTIVKSVVGPSTLNGNSGTFTYNLLVTNGGDTLLQDIKVQDVMTGAIGATITYNNTSDITFDAATKTFTIGTMEPTETKAITYTVTVDRVGTYANVATVSGVYKDNSSTDPSNPSEEIPGVVYTDSDNASVQLNAVIIPDTPDRPERPVTPTPPVTPVPEAAPAIEAAVEVPTEVVPLAAVTLPKTSEIPATLFYGLGGLLGGIGVFMRRKK